MIAVMAPAAAFAGSWVISGNGGMSLPTGDFGDENLFNASSGFQFGGAVDYVINNMFSVGVDGSWNQNKHGGEGDVMTVGVGQTYTLTEDKFKTWQIGVRGKYMVPMSGAISPYLLGGLGMYSTTEKWADEFNDNGTITTDSGENKTDSRFGGKLGAGASYMLNPTWGIGVEGDWNFISEDKAKTDGVSSLQYIGIHGGVSFHVVPK